MKPAAIPDNETERLAALASYQILDSDPELGFDDLTSLAAEILGTPIALISLVDVARQWFKSRVGLAATETSRDLAFCAHAILQPDPLVVPDADLDERFSDNPLVTGAPYVRFYAGVPLVNPQGHALGTLCVIDHVPRQISEPQLASLARLGRQVVRLLELRRTRDEALKAASAKAEFLATISHELRTPLTGVLGMTDLLLETALSTEQRELASTTKAAGTHLLAVINDVLDFSRLESGQVAFERIPFDLEELVTQGIALFAPTARAKGVELVGECELQGQRHRLGDPTRIRQALLNLVANAIKFTASGKVTVRVSVAGGQDVLLAVTDTGIGIPAAQLSGLFTRFTQVDSTTTRRFGGSGLGLAIARHIVEQLGGAVGVRSEVGQGSRFWLRIPLAAAAATEAVGPSRATDPGTVSLGLRILVAEDNEVNCLLFKKMLERLGCQPTFAGTGVQALAALDVASFDLILMDHQMPEMDGAEATRRIRGSGAAYAQIPIVALSAGVLEADRKICIDAGMSHFLGKPLRLRDLQDMLEKLRATSAASHSP